MLRTATIVLLSALLLAFAGCASGPHDVLIESSVNPLPAGAPPPQSYWIRTRRGATEVESLRYKEAIGHIKTALSGRGLFEAPNEQTADMVVELDYGVSSRRQRFDVEEERRRGKAKKDRKAAKSPGGHETAETADDARGGRREIVMDTNFYEKRVSIEARSGRPHEDGEAPQLLWRVTARNVDDSDDLRRFVPILASATIDYIGTETDGEKHITVDEDGKDVAFVKKGM